MQLSKQPAFIVSSSTQVKPIHFPQTVCLFYYKQIKTRLLCNNANLFYKQRRL